MVEAVGAVEAVRPSTAAVPLVWSNGEDRVRAEGVTSHASLGERPCDGGELAAWVRALWHDAFGEGQGAVDVLDDALKSLMIRALRRHDRSDGHPSACAGVPS